MHNYEACVILNAQLPEDQLSQIITKMQDIFTAGGATILQVSKWGKRRLGHEINKSNEGYYVVFFFTMTKSAETLTNFIKFCRYDDNVLRQMIVNVPTKKRGREVEQIVPEAGWLSDFSMRLRPSFPRRRYDGPPGDRGRGGRGGYGGGGYGGDRGPAPAPSEAAPAGEAAPAPEAVAAPAQD